MTSMCVAGGIRSEVLPCQRLLPSALPRVTSYSMGLPPCVSPFLADSGWSRAFVPSSGLLKALAAAKYCYQVASPDHRRAVKGQR